jgi:hypothetical protein
LQEGEDVDHKSGVDPVREILARTDADFGGAVWSQPSWLQRPIGSFGLHEKAAYPHYDHDMSITVVVMQWHEASNPGHMFDAYTLSADHNQLVAPALFVDGHSQRCDFTGPIKKNPMRGLEPTKDWIWYKPKQ